LAHLITPAETTPADVARGDVTRGDVARGDVAAAGAGTGNAARRTARRRALLLAVGWLCQAGLRAWFSRAQAAPLANPDETAYLIAARVLAGGTAANLSGSTLYPGGYPLLITPVYWFTSNPVTVYHAVLIINAAISAMVMPLGYLACGRLGLDRRAAYGVAMIAALVPAGCFYSEYAMADAIFPVIMLAWLLTVHSWLVATSARARYAAAVGSALLAGFGYAVHSRGLVMLLGYAAVGALIAWRRPAARGTVAAAGLTALTAVGAGWALDRYLASAIYPDGTRSLSGQLVSRLASAHGAIRVVEMAGGQVWRLTLDSWGIAGIGLIAALAAIGQRGLRPDLRIMAALSVAVTVLIAGTAPAALPPDQPQTWASGRYLDGMIVTFLLAGAVVLLRASTSRILGCAACVTGLTVVAAVTVAVYAGASLPTAGFGDAFNFAEPAVLTQDWTQASVATATAAALGMLALWIAGVLVVRRWPGVRLAAGLGVLGLSVATVSLLALAQMTSHVSQRSTPAQAADTTGLVTASGLRPGEQIAVASDVSWELWVPQAFEISWTQPEFFNPASQPPPAGVTVVETAWPAGQPARASWPQAPAGWRIVASDQAGSWPWVAWRKS
jgi:hypothetical protein